MPLYAIILAGGAVFAGVLLQGAVGFGMGLFTIPILLWLGIDLPVAITLLTVSNLAQALYGGITYRRHIPWRAIGQTTPLRIVGMIAGIALLWHLHTLPAGTIKQIIGIVMLIIIAAQVLLRIKPRPHPPIGWALLAAPLSGLMAGSIGMGGPPIVFWTMAHDWPSRVTRSFFWVTFGLLMPPLIAVMLLTFGSPVLHGLLIGCYCIPLALLAARLGLRLGERLNRRHLRVAAYVLLSLIALSGIVGPLLTSAPADPPAATVSPASPSPAPSPSTAPGDSPARP